MPFPYYMRFPVAPRLKHASTGLTATTSSGLPVALQKHACPGDTQDIQPY